MPRLRPPSSARPAPHQNTAPARVPAPAPAAAPAPDTAPAQRPPRRRLAALAGALAARLPRARAAACVALLACLLIPQEARPGAWPRAAGATFLSFESALDAPLPSDREDPRPFARFEQVYVERGLGGGLTLAGDAYREDMSDRPWSAMVTLRRLLARLEDGSVISVESGMGVSGAHDGAESLRMRAGISFGRGFSAPFPGWLSLELSHESRPMAATWDSGDTGKAAITVGAHPAEDLMAMLQLRAETPDGRETLLILAPSAAWRLGEALTLQLSGETGLRGEVETEMSLKVWLEF